MNRLQFLLTKLAEEGTEVAQIALKTSQFGMKEKHPDLAQNNEQRIKAELNDLLTIVHLLNEEFDFNFEENEIHRQIKLDKLNKFYRYSKDLGMIKES